MIWLILTLPISTTTTERAFSAMKIVKTRLCNRTKNDFLANYLIVYIVKEIAERFTIDMIIDDFYFMKERRTQLKLICKNHSLLFFTLFQSLSNIK